MLVPEGTSSSNKKGMAGLIKGLLTTNVPEQQGFSISPKIGNVEWDGFFPFWKSGDLDSFLRGYFFTKGESWFWLTASSQLHAVNALFLFRFVGFCGASKKRKTCGIAFCESDKGHVLFEVSKSSDLILEKLFEPLEWIHRCFDVISPRSLFQQQKDTKCIRR